MQPRIAAIIPARGGSKRLPGKNIMEFNGRPMLAWTVEAARASGLFEVVHVSTDCEQIAETAIKNGAMVPFLRDPADADDMTPVWTATINALIRLEAYCGHDFDVVVQLMPNCPLRNAQNIRQTYVHFQENKLSFLISVFKYGWMNPWWAIQLSADTGEPIFLFPQARKRSQDLPRLYCPSGAIWIADTVALKQQRTFYGVGWRTYPLDWRNAIDIDDMDDYRMALAIASQLGSER
jgi:CMP-N-acetylneuraminic acid synthetase